MLKKGKHHFKFHINYGRIRKVWHLPVLVTFISISLCFVFFFRLFFILNHSFCRHQQKTIFHWILQRFYSRCYAELESFARPRSWTKWSSCRLQMHIVFKYVPVRKKKTKLWNVIRIAQITQTVNKIVFIVVLYTLFCGEEKLKWWIFFSKVEKPKIFSDINKMWCFSVMHMNFARSRVAFWNKNIKESPDRCQNRMIEHKTEKFFFVDNLLLKLSNKDTDTELCEMEMTEMYDNDLQIRSNL